MSKKLAGKIALVTGGSRNVGKDSAMALAHKGADVVITYVNSAEAAAQTVKELQSLGVRAASIRVNLTGTAELDRLVTEFKLIAKGWGRDSFDILINNAGTMRLATLEIGRAHV